METNNTDAVDTKLADLSLALTKALQSNDEDEILKARRAISAHCRARIAYQVQ